MKPMEVTEGQTVEFTCSVTISGTTSVVPNIRWTTANGRTQARSGLLKFDRVQMQDQGVYTCMMENCENPLRTINMIVKASKY